MTSRKFDTSGNGRRAELLFSSVASDKGWVCVPADEDEDRLEHWDFMIAKDRTRLRVDVKSKRIDVPSWQWDFGEDYVMIELENNCGKKGWLYRDADAIAFQVGSTYLIVNRLKLKDIVRAKLKNKYCNKITAYMKYRRGNRVTTLVPVKDLFEAIIFVWNYEEEE